MSHAESTPLAADEVFRQYEDAPYPGSDDLVFADYWKLPSLAWIEALGNLERRMDEPGVRILVAGCGTGRESFAYSRRFPRARIVGMDYSPRAIDLAREFHLKRAREFPNVEFQVGDLTDPALPAALGQPFDFISCHGVLTYIPQFVACFPVLRACLRPRGLCYLGVNGPSHHSVVIRDIFRRLGLDPANQRDSAVTRARLATLDRWRMAMTSRDAAIDPLAEEPWPYLSSDVFPAHINNLPMEDWVAAAEGGGLHFLGSVAHFRYVNALLNDQQLPADFHALSEAELYRVAGVFAPVPFHQLLFGAAPNPEPPWTDLRRWRPWRNPRMDVNVIRAGIESGADRINVAAGLEDFTGSRILVAPRTARLIAAADGQRNLGDLLREAGLPATPDLGSRLRKLSIRCLLRFLPPE